MKISQFELSDTKPVIELFINVFSESAGDAEGQIIGDLVADLIATTKPKNLIGFIAESKNQLVGSIFFSRFIVPNGDVAFILSPVAVATNEQCKGIGQQLINYGLDFLKSSNVVLVFTYGDPRYYSKSGFRQISENIVKAPFVLSQPEGWLAQSLEGKPINAMQGICQCVEAISHQKYW